MSKPRKVSVDMRLDAIVRAMAILYAIRTEGSGFMPNLARLCHESEEELLTLFPQLRAKWAGLQTMTPTQKKFWEKKVLAERPSR